VIGKCAGEIEPLAGTRQHGIEDAGHRAHAPEQDARLPRRAQRLLDQPRSSWRVHGPRDLVDRRARHGVTRVRIGFDIGQLIPIHRAPPHHPRRGAERDAGRRVEASSRI
jgi:hypothetical protein